MVIGDCQLPFTIYQLPMPIIIALQFLTIFPALVNHRFTPQEMGRAAGWFPLVGVALGATLYGIIFCARIFFPASVAAALTLSAWVIFTRALHLDGFMDSCDGLFGGFTSERRLEIMKDSRVGAFGVAGGILILLLKYSALTSFTTFYALILAPALGRWILPIMIFAFPYAREDGLGFEMKQNVGWREIILATFIAGITSWLVYGWLGFALMLGAAICAMLVGLYAARLLNGLTGDIYGATTIAVEMLTLLFFASTH
jgi:adenosylcobinamide-GDP ribazoletransferase